MIQELYTLHPDLSSDQLNPSDTYNENFVPANDLYQRIAAGEENAFREAHQLYSARLLYYSKRFTGDWKEAEDLVAEVFIALWQSRTQILSNAHLKNFLFAAIRNKAINAAASRVRHAKALDHLRETGPDMEEACDLELIEEEMLHLLDQAISTLPKECRRIFELAWEEEKSPAEIARLLNMNAATVRSQKRRAIQLIQAWIRENSPSILLAIHLLKKYFLFVCTIGIPVCIN